MCAIFSQLARENRVVVVESLSLDAPKTKLLAARLKGMGLGSALVLTDGVDENLWLASRNLPDVLVMEARNADPVSLVHFDTVVITRGALAKVQEMLG
jgi:large subunit ribosomal protein L4